MLVTVRVDPEASGRFLRLAGDQMVGQSPGGLVILALPACDGAISLLAVFGGAVEVLQPARLRERLAELGRRLSTTYAR